MVGMSPPKFSLTLQVSRYLSQRLSQQVSLEVAIVEMVTQRGKVRQAAQMVFPRNRPRSYAAECGAYRSGARAPSFSVDVGQGAIFNECRQ